MSESTITFLVLGVTVAVFVWDRLPIGAVAFGVALSLWATGVLTLDAALAGFGDPTVIFIASLFVVGEALDATGATAWAGQQLIAGAGSSRTRLIALMMGTVALLTALISINGAVAALLPVMAVTAVRLRRPPSQLLMPLAFGAHAGSLLALTGSPVNVIVSEYADDVGVGRFNFFPSPCRDSRSSPDRSRSWSSSANDSCPPAGRRRSPAISATSHRRSSTTTRSSTILPSSWGKGRASPRWSSHHARDWSDRRCSPG